jgi:hypothetical protein
MCGLLTYDELLYTSLVVALIAAATQLVLAFVPRFSALALGNAVALSTVLVPLSLGTCPGFLLWLANLLFFVLLLAVYLDNETIGEEKSVLPVLGSGCGLLTFGAHVFLFTAVP